MKTNWDNVTLTELESKKLGLAGIYHCYRHRVYQVISLQSGKILKVSCNLKQSYLFSPQTHPSLQF
jgi:hypothetical protein